nr:hypothetical protein [Tanacetum cinerariifolium]
MLHKSVFIQSYIVIGPDGRVQSYYGLKLTDILASNSERNDKVKRVVNPTFSLFCEGRKVLLPRFKEEPPSLNKLLDYNEAATSRKFNQAVEEQRIKWMRNNQDTLWVDLYHNACDAVTRGDTNIKGLRKRIVLPRTFIGGPRYMMKNYQDAMALCRTYRNLDLFVTFTSNPKWPEIAEMLAYVLGQKSHDRLEIGTRVFKMKLTELLDDLTKNKIFGDTCAGCAHILLWLEERCKCRNPTTIDDIIFAGLPSLIDDPNRYKVVNAYMLHGPCGEDSKYASYTTEGKCSKHFPKSFVAETVIDADGYAIYRRKDNKVTA